MLKILHVPGIQYGSETPEQMAERDRRAAEWNAYIDALRAFWAAERARPWWKPRKAHPPALPSWCD